MQIYPVHRIDRSVPGDTVDRVQEELQFRLKYRERLAARNKHGTIRAGRRIPAAMSLVVRITETGEYLGKVVIEEVRWLRLKEIASPEILTREYPSDPEKLKVDLVTIYPELQDDSWITFFRFRFEDESASGEGQLGRENET